MRIRMLWVVSCLAVVGVAAPAQAQTELVIDDFRTGAYSEAFVDHPAFVPKYQIGGTIRGGVRQTSLVVTQPDPHLDQWTSVQIRRDGPLVISGGYKSYFGLLLGYGYTATGGYGGLNLNLDPHDPDSLCPGCDHFRIDFDGSDSEMGYAMEVYDNNGNIALLNATQSLKDESVPFPRDFPFAEFKGDPAHPIDWKHIDFVFVLFQTGNVLGGHDFAVTKITAVPPAAPK
jgi:hypothetical protein